MNKDVPFEPDHELFEWVRSVLGAEIQVTFQPPSAADTQGCVGLYLKDVRQIEKRAGNRNESEVKLELSYLVTVSSDKTEQAHQEFLKLLIAAVESRRYEVCTGEIVASDWLAMQATPRPCFILKTAVYHTLQSPKPPPVTVAPVVGMTAPSALSGRLCGPKETPLAAAVVEIPSLGLQCTTDYSGRFRFEALPGEAGSKLDVIIHARGKHIARELEIGLAEPGATIISIEELFG